MPTLAIMLGHFSKWALFLGLLPCSQMGFFFEGWGDMDIGQSPWELISPQSI